MGRGIPLVALRDVTVLFPGDFYQLAAFVLKVHQARDREANAKNPHTVQKSRLTLHGLAGCYAGSRTSVKSLLSESWSKRVSIWGHWSIRPRGFRRHDWPAFVEMRG